LIVTEKNTSLYIACKGDGGAYHNAPYITTGALGTGLPYALLIKIWTVELK
jgi:hypothetical protein